MEKLRHRTPRLTRDPGRSGLLKPILTGVLLGVLAAGAALAGALLALAAA